VITNNRLFLYRKSLLSGSGSSAGAVFVKFKNDTNDAVELIDEDIRLQRKTSFDNPTYGAVESMNKSQVKAMVDLLNEEGGEFVKKKYQIHFYKRTLLYYSY